MKLSKKQYEIIDIIRREGKFKVSNCQNPTVKKLEQLGVCVFNSDYTALILTDAGKKLEL